MRQSPEEIKAYQKGYQIAHLEEHATRSRVYRAAHPEKIAAYNKGYRATHQRGMMNKHNRKAVVSKNGQYVTVLGKDGKEWRLCPASFCTWAAKDPEKKEFIGFGTNVWEAIREAQGVK